MNKPTGEQWRNWKRNRSRARERMGMPRNPESWEAEWNDCVGYASVKTTDESRAQTKAKLDGFKILIDAARHPISFESLCDKIGKPPGETRKLIAMARETGIELRIGRDHIQLSPEEQVRTVQQSNIQPTTSGRQMVGVLSDLHLGSKYCLREQLIDCVQHFYSRGIRHILIAGDLLDGCYKHGVFELSHTGLEDQTQDLFETLPKLPGLSYHAITGNHDHTFTELTGVNVGQFITGYFAERGRRDIRFYGNCGAFVEIMGAVIHLHHGMGGGSYAKSYKLQKQIEKYGAGEKPHILLMGHYHQFCEVEERGVYGILLPTFQASGSAFSKRLGGHPAIGGVILEWDIAGQDLIRNFSLERRRYFEVEHPSRIE